MIETLDKTAPVTLEAVSAVEDSLIATQNLMRPMVAQILSDLGVLDLETYDPKSFNPSLSMLVRDFLGNKLPKMSFYERKEISTQTKLLFIFQETYFARSDASLLRIKLQQKDTEALS